MTRADSAAARGADLAAMRENYSLAGLAEGDLAPDWVTQFRSWLADAVSAGVAEPNAMVVATASPDGAVASRCVLCKGLDERGVVFYTNLNSDKSRDLQANPQAAVTFPWIALQRQVHFRGRVERVSDADAEQYWATRPRGSRILGDPVLREQRPGQRTRACPYDGGVRQSWNAGRSPRPLGGDRGGGRAQPSL